jgi:hypothetical protein
VAKEPPARHDLVLVYWRLPRQPLLLFARPRCGRARYPPRWPKAGVPPAT